MAILGANLNTLTNPNPNLTSLTYSGDGILITSTGTSVTTSNGDFNLTNGSFTYFKPGDTLSLASDTGIIASIESDTELTLVAPFSNGDVTSEEVLLVIRPRVVSPYIGDIFVGTGNINPEWEAQGTHAFCIPRTYEVNHHTSIEGILVDLVANADVNYTMTLWILSPFGDWTECVSFGTNNYTGRKSDYLKLIGLYGRTMYFSIDELSGSSNLSVAVDEAGLLAELL